MCQKIITIRWIWVSMSGIMLFIQPITLERVAYLLVSYGSGLIMIRIISWNVN